MKAEQSDASMAEGKPVVGQSVAYWRPIERGANFASRVIVGRWSVGEWCMEYYGGGAAELSEYWTHWTTVGDLPDPPRELTQAEVVENAWQEWWLSFNADDSGFESVTLAAWNAALAWERAKSKA